MKKIISAFFGLFLITFTSANAAEKLSIENDRNFPRGSKKMDVMGAPRGSAGAFVAGAEKGRDIRESGRALPAERRKRDPQEGSAAGVK